jgi:hypothetical protein
MTLTPDQRRFQRDLALKEVRRARNATDRHPMSDQRIANVAAKASGATPEQVLNWMKEART